VRSANLAVKPVGVAGVGGQPADFWIAGCAVLSVMPDCMDPLVPLCSQDNVKERPIMIHRAILGSLERFMGILIEDYAGMTNLPKQRNVTALAALLCSGSCTQEASHASQCMRGMRWAA